ncbi:squalene synthase HpnC [Acidiphilium sp. AL]|uniref:Squalene synthase HpnC n=1 Tax=Acidiphilium iwatense TaxID=768198 RepID=A0ABS9DRM0_9PROT|nr:MULTISPECIES: squalene synthase HpnC [Acidiphilium]MCF3945390.1 squalene synthase HpnC [Acidiphilium iwatense]MCU4158906.1 squalene synthase HpnC [Acidiphilium sp. AL]
MSADLAAPNVETWSGKDRGDENFPVGSWLIRADLRRHVHAYYAFARNADDIADHPDLASAQKIARLDAMEAVLTGAAAEGSPSAARLRTSLAQTGVSAVHARELLIAFRQDAVKRRYADWGELMDYCRYSAAPVGRYVLDLHGESEATWPASDALCASLQVMNHLQDCAKDFAELDRSYLPGAWLAREGATAEDVRAPKTGPGLRRVFDAMLAETALLNDQARALPGLVRARRLRVETAIICGLARRLHARLRRGDPLAARVRLRTPDAIGAILASLPRFA